MPGERFQRLAVIGRGRLGPGRDRALLQRQRMIRHDHVRVDPHLVAEAVADRAGAEGVVEREQPRLDLGDGEAGDRAGELGREGDALRFAVLLLLIGIFEDRDAVGQLQRLLQQIRQPRAEIGPDHDAVHDHVDVVLELLVERRRVRDLVELAIDLDALEAALQPLRHLLAELALAAAHHRRQQIAARLLRQLDQPVDHLLHRLALDRQAGRGRIGNAGARPQQAHIVVDLGDGADGRARVLRGRLLLDRDRRREPVDLVDIGLLHHLEELAGIGRKALDIAALPLGIDRVEGERGLARAGKAGEDHELVARNREVDVLEVVLARAAHGDGAAVRIGRAVAVEHVFQRSSLLGSRLGGGDIGLAGHRGVRCDEALEIGQKPGLSSLAAICPA
ncbi:hypothetical protein BTHI11S_05192 [Bosea thiooxidans]